ncbi:MULTISPECIES: carbon storage regulator CsrA [Pseudomonas]|jgi:carbon storage regulator|uniref:Translational regulator CsrA n=1 Tax=Pseudomonas mosselii TaxID=78327 RepID=A0A5R8Z7U4_9PSED|nr:carbon storage regulator CsrA [Pseudomonas mosselii]TLP61197.1 carbon storage regulator CsrA [Pseudomonas mosselii]
MLVIGREVGEVILISEHIRIEVVSVDGRQVKLGISAPREVQVHRVEVYKRIQQQEKPEAQG